MLIYQSHKILLEVLTQRLPDPGTIICVNDFAYGLSTKCPKFSKDASTQLRAKTASASFLSKYFPSFPIEKRLLEVDTRNNKQLIDQLIVIYTCILLLPELGLAS